jgi:hypothetical protein
MSIHEKRPWYSALLFARPSWVSGIARLFDWSATLNEYNRSRTPEEADYLALASDWYAVGDDIRGSMNEGVVRPIGDQDHGDEAESGRPECAAGRSR